MRVSLGHCSLPRRMPKGVEGAQPRNSAIVWLRHDLRLQDHAAFAQACVAAPHYLVPAFFLDPKLLLARTDVAELADIPTVGPYRLRFYLEALQDLSSSLTARGSSLYFSLCSPAEGIAHLTQHLSPEASQLQLYHYVYSGQARASEEIAVAAAFREAAGDTPCSINSSWGHTMYHPQDALQALRQQKKSSRQKADSQTADLDPNLFSDAAQSLRDASLFESIPGVMTDFRKAMEAGGHVEQPRPAPSSLPAFPRSLHSNMPAPEEAVGLYRLAGAEGALQGLRRLVSSGGDSEWPAGDGRRDARSAMPFAGGEAAGHRRLQEILYGSQGIADGAPAPNGRSPTATPPSSPAAADSSQGAQAESEQEDPSANPLRLDSTLGGAHQQGAVAGPAADPPGGAAGGQINGSDPESPGQQHSGRALIHGFKDTRMLASGVDNSAKLSAYLAAGCLSPRQVYWAAKDAAKQQGADTGHSWLIMHLIIRDFFLYTALKEGARVERPQGLREEEPQWAHSPEAFQRWAGGATGLPFVDACMRELATTGYMSNRGRQNVSSFLCKAMRQKWWVGAAVFEALLVDHDWAVNTVNWAYFGGVGNDPRDRVFRTVSQGMTYDPDAALIKAWLPELRKLPPEYAHKPWEADNSVAAQSDFDLNKKYVAPLLDVSTQIAVNYGMKRS